MQVDQVTLSFTPGNQWAYLRKLCGHDEQSVTGRGTVDAIRLLDRLLVSVTDTNIGPGNAKALTIADRDRLLANIYIHTYGPRIESTVRCKNCDALFDMDFSLEELITHLNSKTNKIKVKKGSDGAFKLPNGSRFRFPTGEDECAVLGMSPKKAEITLLKLCILEGTPSKDIKPLQQKMRNLAPLLDLYMQALCPECGQKQTVHFDIQYYLLTAIKQEKNQLINEVHRLATVYGWSLNEILSLPRSIRQVYVTLVESELSSR